MFTGSKNKTSVNEQVLEDFSRMYCKFDDFESRCYVKQLFGTIKFALLVIPVYSRVKAMSDYLHFAVLHLLLINFMVVHKSDEFISNTLY
jgi:hypothetical protein